MLTNPNTLGLFERDITEIAAMVHDVGGLLYYDGANLNALLGRARPGDMGFDVMHYNVHKTFATPHGGGGPGAGPVGVVDELAPFLPAPPRPRARRGLERGDPVYERFDPDHTIGKVHGFDGNWLVLLKTFAYIARLGDEGLADASASAVLNANYLAERIEYDIPYGPFHHEFVASAGEQDAADVAKRMLDYGVHPPTTKWPEIVPEALMTEPTEIESKDTLDRLAAAFNGVAGEDDSTLEAAPERTTARRIDQTSAARNPRLSWQALSDDSKRSIGSRSSFCRTVSIASPTRRYGLWIRSPFRRREGISRRLRRKREQRRLVSGSTLCRTRVHGCSVVADPDESVVAVRAVPLDLLTEVEHRAGGAVERLLAPTIRDTRVRVPEPYVTLQRAKRV